MQCGTTGPAPLALDETAFGVQSDAGCKVCQGWLAWLACYRVSRQVQLSWRTLSYACMHEQGMVCGRNFLFLPQALHLYAPLCQEGLASPIFSIA
eukprot:343081-Pelagomonas_calceolata.AAC.1